jgi:hypothetical protein
MVFSGVGGMVALIAIIAVCAFVFTMAIRDELK